MKIISRLLITIFIISSCNGQQKSAEKKVKKQHQYTNALVNETSPYLLQHPWNEQTLDKAKREGKLLLISIGYSACHWCHVMEHESFEDAEVAKIMNENYKPTINYYFYYQ